MTLKSSKLTLKSLQSEINDLKEELNQNRTELNDVKDELKNVKEEQKANKTESVENPKVSQEPEFKCKVSNQPFGSKKILKMHNQTNHAPQIKCESCDEIFEKNCDLEYHIERSHKFVEKFECEKCCKTFVLKWRFKKHQENHTNQSIRKCHYFNNQKCCPFEIIGCMFLHTLSDKCKYGGKCTKKLCSFQHES